jgi:hypothetical protein
MTASLLIDDCLKKIGKFYMPGLLPWLKKNRPEDWKEFLSLETKINRAALRDNKEGLAHDLKQYKVFVEVMESVFCATGNLFSNE